MTPRGRKFLLRSLALVIAAVALEGCISPVPTESGRYTSPIGGSPVISNETPYSGALRCLGRYTSNRPLRIAVGQIADYTGKNESDNSGRKLTQGAALMAMSALSKAGVPLVERFDTSVAEMELKYSNNKLIGEEKAEGPGDYRKIMAGSIPGSNYYLVGGITELNFNIRSEGANADGGGVSTRRRSRPTFITYIDPPIVPFIAFVVVPPPSAFAPSERILKFSSVMPPTR